MLEQHTDSAGNRRNAAVPPFLVVMLIITILMAVASALFHIQIFPEIIGFTGLVLIFWLVTEMMGWKSSPAHYNPALTTQLVPDESVKRLFSNLPGTCEVFHDINTGHGKIDHLIFSREHGLFVVEIKNHSGKVMSADTQLSLNNLPPDKDYFVNIIWNSFWLMERVRKATKLEVTVTPVIVLPNATVDVAGPINGVSIIRPDNLTETISKAKIDPAIAASLWAIHESGVQPW